MSQPQPNQQPRLNDFQMMQRQNMLKQFQQLQRQYQLQESGDPRQQSLLGQQSIIDKQVYGDQFPPLIHGIPIHDGSQRFMAGNLNFGHHGMPPIVQGFPNGIGFSQAQSQTMYSTASVSPQLDESLYGTPIAGAGSNLGAYSGLLGGSHDSANKFIEGMHDQAESIVQSSSDSKSLRSNQYDNSSYQIHMQQQGETFYSRQVFQDKNLFGEVPARDLRSEAPVGNFQQMNMLQRHTPVLEVGKKGENAGWPGLFAEKLSNNSPSGSLCSLDPLEQKILFDTGDDILDSSYGKNSRTRTGEDGNMDNIGHSDAFPSVHSGSWSALMQSAVAEASSSDTGLQEEWSGLSFQNPEISTENQLSSFIDNLKPQINSVDNKLQSSAPKSELQYKNNSMSSGFPGFQQSGVQISLKQKQGMHLETSNESSQKSANINSNRLDGHPQQKHSNEKSQPVQRLSPMQSAWHGKSCDFSESDAHRQSTTSSINGPQEGYVTGAAPMELHNLRKIGHGDAAGSFSNSAPGLQHTKSVPVNASSHVLENRHFVYMKGAEFYGEDSRAESKGNNQRQRSNSPQIFINSHTVTSGTYGKQQHFQREKSTDSYHSHASKHTNTGNELKENVWLRNIDSRHMAENNLKPPGQVPVHQVPQGLSGNELPYADHFKFNGNISSSGMDLDKGNFLAIRETPKHYVGSDTSDFLKGAFGIHSPNLSSITNQTRLSTFPPLQSQNMLELLHKVDKSKDYQLGMHFESKESVSFTEVPQTENPNASASKAQVFGLRLSPPLERVVVSNFCGSSQSSPQTEISCGTVSLGLPDVRNQAQNLHQLIAPLTSQSQESTVPCSRSSQESHFIPTNSHGQEPKHIAESGTSHQPELLMRQPNIWTKVPTQQNLSDTEPRMVSFSLLPSPESITKGLETAATVPRGVHGDTYFKGGNKTSTHAMNSRDLYLQGEHVKKERTIQKVPSAILDLVSQEGKFSYEKESAEKSISETNTIRSGPLMRNSQHQGVDSGQHGNSQARKVSDLVVFGRSLKPSHVPSQNYSNLHQLQTVRNVQRDAIKEVMTKYDGDNSDLTDHRAAADSGEQLHDTSKVRNVANSGPMSDPQPGLFPIEDCKMQHFSSETSEKQSTKILGHPLRGTACQELLTYGEIGSQDVSHPTMQSQINLQMAPSWFKHFATSKNGQILPMVDPKAVQKFSPIKDFDNVYMDSTTTQWNSSPAAQGSSGSPTTSNTLLGAKQSSASLMSHPDVGAKNLAVSLVKKRKYAAFEFLPWHKEVTQGTRRLPDISFSDLKWAQAANRLDEKVDDAAAIEDAPAVRPKKRLVLTTQIMQHLFQPPAAVILSGYAASNCDNVTYFAARLALGDACSSSSSLHIPSDVSNKSSGQPKPIERNGDQELKKLVKNFINQSKKLEADFLTLDKTASISDIRLESQELEKISIVNRLAKFLMNGQLGAAETSSSSGTRGLFQRYVKAAPMPDIVPEGAQCLSL